MSRAILVIGESGSGKTTSAEFLNPDETYYINSDGNGLPFAGWKNKYNTTKKNYYETSDIDKVEDVLEKISTNRPEIKTVIIDTINALMLDREMSVNFRMRKSGNESREKWMDLAMEVYDLILKSRNLRDDLVVVFMGHITTYEDNYGTTKVCLVTNGRKLEKIKLETKFKVVLLTRVDMKGSGNNEYYFETQASNSTAKSPRGMFEFKIPNNLDFVIKRIREFEEQETKEENNG